MRRRTSQDRDGGSGRFTARPPAEKPAAAFLEALEAIARQSARKVYNDPRLDLHITRSVLGWLINWDGKTARSVQAYIALRAANEARRALALDNDGRRVLYGRSHDAVRAVARVRAWENLNLDGSSES